MADRLLGATLRMHRQIAKPCCFLQKRFQRTDHLIVELKRTSDDLSDLLVPGRPLFAPSVDEIVGDLDSVF